MSIAKNKRENRRQLGQFLTPVSIANDLVAHITFKLSDKILEPSMGDGAFIIPIIEKFLALYEGPIEQRLALVLANNVYGVEIDQRLYDLCLDNIRQRWGSLPPDHHLLRQDFFRCRFLKPGQPWIAGTASNDLKFDYILGNPPFGGTIDPALQDALDSQYGSRNGEKIKKETYSFFIVKSLDLLASGGMLQFICSDTFLTINTMRGLRRLLMREGQVDVEELSRFSDETNHPMLVLRVEKSGPSDTIRINGKLLARSQIELTANSSWRITDDLARYFSGALIGDYLIASSGMTIGKNEYFVREIVNNTICEPYTFEFFDDPITLENEMARARLAKLSMRQQTQIRQLELGGATRRNVRIIQRPTPLAIALPHPDYAYYNKAVNAIVYTPPTHAIYWKDQGDAVLTFKKNGNWYLHGVGGQKFFMREALTWQLIAQTLYIRYLPPGYILDSGGPCAFLRPGISHDELHFILGWGLTSKCNEILKKVINHTKNIQGKDFERLPYPFWVCEPYKARIVEHVRGMIQQALDGRTFGRQSAEIEWLEKQFEY